MRSARSIVTRHLGYEKLSRRVTRLPALPTRLYATTIRYNFWRDIQAVNGGHDKVDDAEDDPETPPGRRGSCPAPAWARSGMPAPRPPRPAAWTTPYSPSSRPNRSS